jgi:cell division transport system permease protein
MREIKIFFVALAKRIFGASLKQKTFSSEPVPLRAMAPIVPPRSIAGRALVVVLGIMCFLACLAVAGVVLVVQSASDWQRGIAREATIQVRPIEGVSLEGELSKALALARATPGVTNAKALSKKENEQLLAAWFGSGIGFEDLPIPRMLALELNTDTKPDLEDLRLKLTAQVKGASLDDHRLWRDRLALMTGSVVALGILILILVLVAATLSVIFSTRAAMAANRDIVEVLNLVGADDDFIAGAFQRRFLQLGFEGGLLGASAALLAFPLTEFFIHLFFGAAGQAQLNIFIGGTGLTLPAIIAIFITLFATALIAALTSRITVGRYLKEHM